MAQYIFVYLGGEYPSDPAEAHKHLEKFQQWLISLGDSVISPAIPFKDTHTVQPDGTTTQGTMSAMSGLGIMKFASMQEATAAAQSCPFLEINGTLEISEMVEMSAAPEGGSESIN
jgi:hypothetical protein